MLINELSPDYDFLLLLNYMALAQCRLQGGVHGRLGNRHGDLGVAANGFASFNRLREKRFSGDHARDEAWSNNVPHFSASCAPIESPVSTISIVRDLPIALVRRCVPPAPGIRPILISGWPNFARSLAMMMSAYMASSQPPPN
ncbi:hypothetical protein TYRP_011571 [Tyrophagus putrescentiae]|nr:hypothetical protein TYRP_011571 [Tyrophagus putrescentiae]